MRAAIPLAAASVYRGRPGGHATPLGAAALGPRRSSIRPATNTAAHTAATVRHRVVHGRAGRRRPTAAAAAAAALLGRWAVHGAR